MIAVSIVKRSQIDKTNRLDAEFYQPKYLQVSEMLNKVPRTRLHTLTYISDGNHLKVAEKFLSEPGIRYLRGQDISSDMLIDDRHPVYVPDSVYDLLGRSHIFQNDVLVTIVGANTGLVGLVYDAPSKLTANCKLGIVRAKDGNAAYLYGSLISKYGQYQILRNKRGGGQTGLILPDLRNLLIPYLPSIEDQISAQIINAHTEIKKSKQLYSLAEQQLLEEIGLLNWRPTHTLNFLRYYHESVQSRRLDAEYFQPKFKEMFDSLKKNLRLDRLSKLTVFTKGIEVGSAAYSDNGIPFWRVSNLSKYGIDSDNLNYISNELYQSLRETYQPMQGELLLSKDATPGIAYYLENTTPGIISSGVLRLKFIDDIPPQYLELILNSKFVQLQIEQDAGGSVIKHWKPTEIKKTLIPRLSSQKEVEIASLVQQSHFSRNKAKSLIEKVKKAIEIAVEDSEHKAKLFLDS
jgi:restriction endonuclease S subunit